MAIYRTRTYIAADFDNDGDAVEQLYRWNDSVYWSLSFSDAHELQTSRDDSLPCSIKDSLRYRMRGSNTFVLVVGDSTNSITKGGCQYCNSYDSDRRICLRNHSVDYRSYVEYECDLAVMADLRIIVLYKSTYVDRSKCPIAVRYRGTHVPMKICKGGGSSWDYQSVRQAFDS